MDRRAVRREGAAEYVGRVRAPLRLPSRQQPQIRVAEPERAALLDLSARCNATAAPRADDPISTL